MSELAFNRVILEKYNRIMTWIVLILLGLSFTSIFLLMHTSAKPPIIVFSRDGQLEVLKVKELKIDETFLKDFVKMIAGQYLSFSVSSLPKQIEGIKPYLADKPADSILNSFKDNQSVITKDGISQQFVINSITISKYKNPFWVEVEGVRNIHANSNDKSMPITYIFEIKKVRASEENPYGFLMTDIIEKDQSKGLAK